MFFGMCNSPATFQAMMDLIFKDMIEGTLVIVYMDDILIFAKTQEELEQITKLVLQWLWDNDLFLKPKKCKFNKMKIEYLGLMSFDDTGRTTINGSSQSRRTIGLAGRSLLLSNKSNHSLDLGISIEDLSRSFQNWRCHWTICWRRIPNSYRPKNVRRLSTCWRNDLWKNPC